MIKFSAQEKFGKRPGSRGSIKKRRKSLSTDVAAIMPKRFGNLTTRHR